MEAKQPGPISSRRLVEGLSSPAAYGAVAEPGSEVQVIETHISWIFLVGDRAFKVKKPIQTDFLDYSTLSQRQRFCDEELRLNQRYAPELYVGVVPIVVRNDRLSVLSGDEVRPAAPGRDSPDAERIVEYAVEMRRFPADALLSQRLDAGRIHTGDVASLADVVADFHHRAGRLGPDDPLGDVRLIEQAAVDNLQALRGTVTGEPATMLEHLTDWTSDFFQSHREAFAQRVAAGFIRECHGDLHLANIIFWQDRWMLFDGIEFNQAFHWIDVLSDAAFTAMDFEARGHAEFGHSFVSHYLEMTGDHASLSLLRWYLVYRALTRAKVAAIRAHQSGGHAAAEIEDCRAHIRLAKRFSEPTPARLWITHGLSGSGKTTRSEQVVQQFGAIRLRSDCERKRHFGLRPTDRVGADLQARIYSQAATTATYRLLRRKAIEILRAGYSVIVDATFLNRSDRLEFRQLAADESVAFAILHCEAEEAELRQRILERQARDEDASDAGLDVLAAQMESRQPLDEEEQRWVAVDAATGLPDQPSQRRPDQIGKAGGSASDR